MSLLQHCFTADAKFLTSFRTVSILALWHGADGTFSFFLILAQHCAFVSSFNRELKQRHSTHVNRKWDFYIFWYVLKPKFLLLRVPLVLIERFARKFGHHNARQNTAQGCKKRTLGWRASGSKRLLSSLIKCWIISTCRTLYLHFSFSLNNLPNLLQGQSAWICGIPFTRVFIPPRFSSPLSTNIYCFYCAF